MIDFIKKNIPSFEIQYDLFDKPYAIYGNTVLKFENDVIKVIRNQNTDKHVTKSYSYDKFKKDYVVLIT